MDTIKYTQITEETQKLEIEGGGEKIEVIEESVEVINVAAAEVRKIEAAAAAQAEAIKARAAEAEGSAVEEETEAEPAFEAEEVELSTVEEAVEEAEAAASAEDTAETATAAELEAAAAATEAEIAAETATAAEPDAAAAVTAAEAEITAEETAEASAEPEEAVASEHSAKSESETVRVIGVRFKTAGKVYYFDPGEWEVKHGCHVIVETVRGIEYGTVVGLPMNVKASKVTQPLKEVIRVATPEDTETEILNRVKEREAYRICQEKIQAHGLDMKLINAEYTFDNSKVPFATRPKYWVVTAFAAARFAATPG